MTHKCSKWLRWWNIRRQSRQLELELSNPALQPLLEDEKDGEENMSQKKELTSELIRWPNRLESLLEKSKRVTTKSFHPVLFRWPSANEHNYSVGSTLIDVTERWFAYGPEDSWERLKEYFILMKGDIWTVLMKIFANKHRLTWIQLKVPSPLVESLNQLDAVRDHLKNVFAFKQPTFPEDPFRFHCWGPLDRFKLKLYFNDIAEEMDMDLKMLPNITQWCLDYLKLNLLPHLPLLKPLLLSRRKSWRRWLGCAKYGQWKQTQIGFYLASYYQGKSQQMRIKFSWKR